MRLCISMSKSAYQATGYIESIYAARMKRGRILKGTRNIFVFLRGVVNPGLMLPHSW
jgi:hypothetical protein